MAAIEKPKAKKIVDITAPNKTVATAGARPVLITNRPLMANDPMVVSSNLPNLNAAGPQSRPAGEVLPRQERVLVPQTLDEINLKTEPLDNEPKITRSYAVENNGTETISKPDSSPQTNAETFVQTKVPDFTASSRSNISEETEPTEQELQNETDKLVRQAELQDKEQESRLASLEAIIEKGTYAVPINAVNRQRSHKRLVLLVVLMVAVLLVGGIVAVKYVAPNQWAKITKSLPF